MIPIDEGAPRDEPKPNPYLVPVHAGSAGRVYNPTKLVYAVLELKNAAHTIGAALFRAGYAYPKQDIVEAKAKFESTAEGMEVTFPPPGPFPGDTVVVVDQAYRCAEVPYDEDTVGGTIYFDLDTGEWVTFTTFIGNTHLTDTYKSLAAKYPIPSEEPRA